MGLTNALIVVKIIAFEINVVVCPKKINGQQNEINVPLKIYDLLLSCHSKKCGVYT